VLPRALWESVVVPGCIVHLSPSRRCESCRAFPLQVTKACDLVISDFGLARQIPEGEGPMTEHVVTRWYRAPERPAAYC